MSPCRFEFRQSVVSFIWVESKAVLIFKGKHEERVRRSLTHKPAGDNTCRICVFLRFLRSAECGQATIELVGFLPLAITLAFGAFTLISAYSARGTASSSAQAGAMALLQNQDPSEAAQNALPEGLKGKAKVIVAGRKVTVSVVPRGPIQTLNKQLVAKSSADAG
jgi:hypothetical protein